MSNPLAEEEEGFYFDFEKEEEGREGAEETRARRHPNYPAPTISLKGFPWIPVGLHSHSSSSSMSMMDSWLSRYPSSVSASRHTEREEGKQRAQTRPMVLQEGAYQLCYQTPPEIESLTGMDSKSAEWRSQGFFVHEEGEEAPQKIPVERRDIIPGKYYGGLKVWSCAPDLARYLLQHPKALLCTPPSDVHHHHEALAASATDGEGHVGFRLQRLVVAEVGCGHGLPGLAALCLGVSKVLFQDYNAEVLETCVGPNIAATVRANPTSFIFNDTEEEAGGRHRLPVVKLLHGDWVDLDWDEPTADEAVEKGGAALAQDETVQSPGGKCDVILGSDVTFDPEACEKLAVLLHRWLRPHTGIALIGTKEYYFGTNGGRGALVESLKPFGFQVEPLATYRDGGSMDRVVVRVSPAPLESCLS